jgi:nicotinate-nucleotide pyrophosphorylase
MLHYIPDSEIERFIEEDVPYGDLTTHLLGIGGRRGRITYSTELVELLKEVRAMNPAVKISAAGGINETNITEYAAAGVDIVVLSSVYFG